MTGVLRLLLVFTIAFVAARQLPSIDLRGFSALLDPPIATASRALSSEERAAFDAVNSARRHAGVRPVRYNVALAEAAAKHARYVALHAGASHSETPGEPGFSGTDPSARARSAGYGSGAGEVMCRCLRGDGAPAALAAVQLYLDTVYHRHLLLDPDAAEIGYGAVRVGEAAANVIDIGFDFRASVDEVARYPASRAADVATTWDGREEPDPAPGAARPLGSPVTLGFAYSARPVELIRASLVGPRGPERILTEVRRGAVSALPARPLAPAAEYRVTFEIVAAGRARTETWTFRTAAGR